MKISSNKVKEMLLFFKKELAPLYAEDEIKGLTHYSFSAVLGFSRNDLLLKKEENINESNLLKFFKIVKELKKKKPIQYILGEADFFDLKFKVTSSVLIPRPETEELVQWIIQDNDKKQELSILDIGTGSGCIAVSLKKNIPQAEVSAMDVSKEALAIAAENAEKNQAEIKFIEDDILKAATESNLTFDVIVSNPPYVKQEEKKLMNNNVLNYEPHLALFVDDKEPLLFYEAILTFAENNLNENGAVYFEINEALAEEMKALFTQFNYQSTLKKDLSGKDRMMKGVKIG